MLAELSSYLTGNKFNELRRRLEHIDTKMALAAEAEIFVLWGISKVAHLVSEPILPHSTRRPEASSKDLFESRAAVIEVRALSDDSFSGKEAMERTANLIAGYADRLRRKSGKQLCFEFMERSYWSTRFHRERCVDPHFQLTDQMKSHVRQWLTAHDWPSCTTSICIQSDKTNVVVKRVDPRLGRPRVFCSMPALAYDLENNPIYKALKYKSRQIKGAAEGSLKCVVLVDAGCRLLRHLRARPGAIYEISGEEIIRHVLGKLSIDIVIVLSPHREQLTLSFLGPERLVWKATRFDRRMSVPETEYQKIEQLAALLPPPRFESYQARSLHEQGSFSTNRNKWPLGTTISVNRGSMTIKLSASLLHDYLAGCIDADRFRRAVFSDQNYFAWSLPRQFDSRDSV